MDLRDELFRAIMLDIVCDSDSVLETTSREAGSPKEEQEFLPYPASYDFELDCNLNDEDCDYLCDEEEEEVEEDEFLFEDAKC
jgi:hypothetical protein